MKKFIFLLTCLLLCVSISPAQKKRVPVAIEKLDCQPQLSTETIRSFLRGKTLKDVPEVDGGNETEWTFSANELIELDIIETKITNSKAVSVVNIKSTPRAGIILRDANGELEGYAEISGRLRLNFELIAGEWSLLKIENLSVTYQEFESQIVDQ